MIYREEKRDLFSVPDDYYFVQCISANFGMGKGIAVEFNKRFDVKNRMLNSHTKDHWFNQGYCLDTPDVPVFNLITKQHYWDKPTYDTITSALAALKTLTQIYSVKKLAMPKIGCGLDRLEWSEVSEIIKTVFKDVDIEILVCYI